MFRDTNKVRYLMEMATDVQTKSLILCMWVFFLTFVHSVCWQYMYRELVITLTVNHVDVLGYRWFTSKQPKLGLMQELSFSLELVSPLQVIYLPPVWDLLLPLA